MQHARHVHLGDPDATSDRLLREVLAEAQEDDLGVASAQRGQELGEHVPVVDAGVAVVDVARHAVVVVAARRELEAAETLLSRFESDPPVVGYVVRASLRR